MIDLRAGTAQATVDPDGGGRLTRLTVDGFDLLTDGGCFVMAPWAGRTGYGRFGYNGVEHPLPVPEHHAPHAIHGTVRKRPWTVDAVDAGDRQRAELSIDLGPDWPWAGRCEQSVALTADSLTLELAVHSDGDPFPAVIGWHPWFTKPDGHDLQAAAMLERGPDHLPTGRRQALVEVHGRAFDDCFEDVDWPVTLRWGDRHLAIEAAGCRYVVLYDEPGDATCVEPQTGPPDALNTGEATIVTPDEPLRATTTWRWR